MKEQGSIYYIPRTAESLLYHIPLTSFISLRAMIWRLGNLLGYELAPVTAYVSVCILTYADCAD